MYGLYTTERNRKVWKKRLNTLNVHPTVPEAEPRHRVLSKNTQDAAQSVGTQAIKLRCAVVTPPGLEVRMRHPTPHPPQRWIYT